MTSEPYYSPKMLGVSIILTLPEVLLEKGVDREQRAVSMDTSPLRAAAGRSALCDNQLSAKPLPWRVISARSPAFIARSSGCSVARRDTAASGRARPIWGGMGRSQSRLDRQLQLSKPCMQDRWRPAGAIRRRGFRKTAGRACSARLLVGRKG